MLTNEIVQMLNKCCRFSVFVYFNFLKHRKVASGSFNGGLLSDGSEIDEYFNFIDIRRVILV